MFVWEVSTPTPLLIYLRVSNTHTGRVPPPDRTLHSTLLVVTSVVGSHRLEESGEGSPAPDNRLVRLETHSHVRVIYPPTTASVHTIRSLSPEVTGVTCGSGVRGPVPTSPPEGPSRLLSHPPSVYVVVRDHTFPYGCL